MNKICPKCSRTMSYDPYFKAFICRQCGNTEVLKQQRNASGYRIRDISNQKGA